MYIMKPLEEIKNLLSARKQLLLDRYSVSQIAVFGSAVRGEADSDSDVDVLVDFNRPVSMFLFLDLEEYLSDLLEVKVDLVSRKALKPFIGKRILKEMVVI
jgi:predicted nucleotidyltransferase